MCRERRRAAKTSRAASIGPHAPEAGIAVYVRGDSGKLAAARVYDASDPPLSA